MSEEKKGLWGRLVSGLSKTRDNIVSGIDSIFHGFSNIDDDFYEELEEILIMGDLGVHATMDIIEDLKEKLKKYLTKYDLASLTDAQYTRMVEITREPLVLLSDITDAVPYFFGGENVEIESEVQTTVLDLPESQEVLKAFVEQGEGWEWTEHNLHEKLEAFRGEFKEKGIKPKATMWAIRGAVTGRTRGADMTATLEILGKENCLARAKKSIKTLVG